MDSFKLWRKHDVGWSSNNAIGLSKGIITLWNLNYVESIFSFKGEGFMGVKVRWKNKLYYIINVYSGCNLVLKMSLWGKLLELRKNLIDGLWVLGGDFNSISNSCERKVSGLVNRRT